MTDPESNAGAPQRPPFSPLGLVDRVGGILVAPRRTMAGLLAGGRGGMEDLAILLGLQVLALQLPHLVRVIWFALAVNPRAGLLNLFNLLVQAALVPLLGALVGSMLLGWLSPKEADRSRNLDLASLAAVPMLVLQVLAGVVLWLLGAAALRTLGLVVLVGGVAWFVVLLALARALLREQPPRPDPPDEEEGR